MPDNSPDHDPDHNVAASRFQRVCLTIGLIVVVSLSWSGLADQSAQSGIDGTLKRALLTAAIARGLNGVISVAQGTEIAIQPVGIGVTITAGQILDPLNDLVERFSWLALAASASLGTQLLLTEICAEPAVSWLVTAAAALYLLVAWWPRPLPHTAWLLRLTALTVLVRFGFTIITLTVGLVDHWVLEERQATAMSELSSTTRQLESLEPAGRTPDSDASMLERFDSMMDGPRQALDIEARLNTLGDRVEAAITHLIDLMVVFLVQTLVLPLGALYLALACFRWFWQWSLSRGAA